ncbi:MAG: ABC transporter permease [Blastocatellia bacterium]
METIYQDLRYSVRIMLKSRAFTVIAVLALALGIGANSAIFSVVNSVLLRPLPFDEPDRLLMLWETSVKRGQTGAPASVPNFIDWQNQNTVFEHVAAFDGSSFILTGGAEPERIPGTRVSASLFPLLRVNPLLGRAFTPDDDKAGAKPVAIVSYNFWKQRLGGDTDLEGKTLVLEGKIHSVVGVMPRGFQFYNLESELWTPFAFSSDDLSSRGAHYISVIARLNPGVTKEQAQAEMNTIADRLAEQYPDTNSGRGINLVGLHDQLVGDVRPALLVLLGAVGFVLLIACANVANLLLARAASRHKEVAIRMALGANRGRLVRQLLTESVLLALVGGAVGLLLALWGVDLLTALAPESLRSVKGVGMDGRVLGFTFVVSLLTGIMFGLAPALQASKPDLNESLKEGGRSSSDSRRNRFRTALVVSEVALSLVLLIGAGLMVMSFSRLLQVNPGFNADNVLTAGLSLPDTKYKEPAQWAAFYSQVLEKVNVLPGVQSAGVITNLPFGDGNMSLTFRRTDGPPLLPSEQPATIFHANSPGYFQTMGIPLLKGRDFTEQDVEKAPPVLIINETMARQHFADQDPIGKTMIVGYGEPVPREIVGVVGDVKHVGLAKDLRVETYSPHAQTPLPFATLVVRSTADTASLLAAIRRAVQEVDKDQPVANVRTMRERISNSIAQPRFYTLLLSTFAVVALVLAAVGIYGVLSYSVTQRTREIGIRMALGADRRDIVKLVVGQGMAPAVVGVGIGLAAAFALTRFMASLLFAVDATDPLAFAAISLLLTAVALVACYIPARRATKVDPTVALRYE